MPYRTRILEQLMRTILETQAAMLSAMTQMQQALLSGMIPRKPDELATQSEVIKPEEVTSQPDQEASKQQPSAKPEPQSRRSTQRRTGQLAATSPQRRPTKQAKSQPSWFEKRGEN